MLPPLVASSSSHQTWISQPPEPRSHSSPSNSSSHNVGDHWVIPNSRYQQETLAQAVSSSGDFAAIRFSQLLGGQGGGLDSPDVHDCSHGTAARLRSFIHQQQQRLSAGRGQQHGESSRLTQVASSMPTPADQLKERPGSPLKSSSASSSSSGASMAVSGDGGAALPPHQQQRQESGVNIGSATHVVGFVKPEEGYGTPTASSSPWSHIIKASMALSAQASAGAGASKVTKRRSRASNKAPITVLSADTSNFRAMVQKLTGIPASSSPLASASSMQARPEFPFWDSSTVSILKPQPTRPSSHHSFHGGSLPTLDTSAPFISGNDRSSSAFPQPARLLSSDNTLLQASTFPSLPFPQLSQQKLNSSLPVAAIGLNSSSASNQNAYTNVSNTSDLKSLLQSNLGSSTASLPSLWDPGDGDKLRERSFNDSLRSNNWCNNRSAETSRMQPLHNMPAELGQFSIRQVSSIENFLMEDERQIMDPSSRSYTSVDSWLSTDGVHTSKMELARNA